MQKVIIAGSRTVYLKPKELLAAIRYEDPQGLLWVPEEWTHIVSGRARGMDEAGEELARHLGIEVIPVPVTEEMYAKYGRYIAPKMRNKQMAQIGDGAICVWDGMSGGTSDMGWRMVMRKKPALGIYHPANIKRPKR